MSHLAHFATERALAPVAPIPSPDKSAAILSVAEALQPDLAQGFQIDALRLRVEMERAFGGSDATGAWDWKLAYEAGEAALVLFLRKFGRALLARAGSPAALLPILAKVACLLPTHTRRSEEMERFQQFSTPLPMGLAAMAAAQITARDLVLEPSAGTGLLAVLAEIAGGSLALNELADTRADLLRRLFPGRPVTGFDAAQIDDHLDAGLRPSVILMNPPFSAVANVDARSTEATARHLRSALARLVPGGRLVAITGASFAPDSPAWAETFGRLTETANLVFTGAVSGAAFAKHGTSFETRISVFDKCRGGEAGGITADLARPISPDVASLLSLITAHVPPRLVLAQVAPAGQGLTSPFPGYPPRTTRAAISTSRATPATPATNTAPQIEAADLAYTLRDATEDGASTRLSDAIYETFRLQAIDIPGAEPHPTKLVQSAAMASVAPPKPSYRPKLPAAILRDGLLSDAQLETVIYAGEAHGAYLAGSWTVDETGDMVSAAPDDAADAFRFRRGFFLGDGTGAGKGRQSAGIVLDNWAQGRRKALWISKSDKLLEDAQRDWSALGQERLLVTPLSRFAQGKDIPLTEGILFTTYATLRSEERGARKSRVDQIVDWLGADFDGVILFDESHAMANAAGSKGERGDVTASQQGRAGLRLQHKLPNARVVYVSATGATSVHNLAYAQRLGLWGGEDFPFATRAEFVQAIEAGGVAAMEVLARDLRSLGLYTARSLSYDGVEYEMLVHALTPEQRGIYDAYAGAFAILCVAAHMMANREDAIMRRNAAPSLSFGDIGAASFTLFLRWLVSKGVEPVEQVRVTFPARGSISRCRNSDLFERLSLGFEVGLGIVVGRVEADMPQPASDDGDVDARRDEVDGRRVPEAVRGHMLRTKCGRRFRRRRDVGRQLVPHARRTQWCAISIDEDALVRCARLPLQQLFQQRHRFRPKRADAFLSTFSVKAHAIRCFEPDRLGTEIERLLDARSAIIEQRQQHMVPHPFDRRPVRLRENGLDLPWLTIEPRLRLIRPTEASTVPAKIMDDTHWLEADRAAFAAAWTAELAEVPEFTETTLHIVAGLLLPIWKQLPQDETRVYRLQTDDGQRIIGRRVSPSWVATTLAADAPKLTAAQVHALVLEGKTVVRLAEGMELHRSRVMGVNRIELSGFLGAAKDRLKADGFFSEIIAWKLRLFCPADSSGITVLDRLLARCPVTGLHARGGC